MSNTLLLVKRAPRLGAVSDLHSEAHDYLGKTLKTDTATLPFHKYDMACHMGPQ